MKIRELILTIGIAAFIGAGCSDDVQSTDTGVDLGVDTIIDDMSVDTSTDGPAVDGPVVDGPAVDGPTVDGPMVDGPMADGPVVDGPMVDSPMADGPAGEGMMADGPQVDAGVDTMAPDAMTTKPQVLFSTTKNATSTYTLAQVALDGTGFQLIPGFSADLEACGIGIPGVQGPADVSKDLPLRVNWGGEYHIRLPGGLGRLYRFYDGTDYGLAQISPAGVITVHLDKGATTSTCNSTYYIQVSKDGKLAAMVTDNNKIQLVRLDGTTWPGSTPASTALDVTPTGVTFATAYYNSLVMGATSLLFVTADASSVRSLYSAPLDGSAKAAKITLPMVGGVTPIYILTPPAVSADGKVFATTMGASSSKEDVVVIKGTTATNISKINDNLHSPGYALGDNFEPRVALSGQGTYVAYASTTSASTANEKKAWVAKTDGTSTIELSSATNFVRGSGSTDVDSYGSFIWTDDDNLLFGAGTTTTKVDLFRYKVSTGALSNLTKTGTNTAAPWDGGLWELDGAWVNPTKTYIFYVAGTSTSMNIIGVNLTSFVKNDVTTGLNINSESSLHHDMEGAEGSKYIWFVAKKTSGTVEDLYVFDQSTASAASLKNLTNHTGTTSVTIDGLTTSPDGAYASYIMGSGATAILYAVAPAGTPKALNGTGSHLEPAYVWTKNSKGIVFGGGATTSTALDLKVVTVPAGVVTTLHTSQSYIYVIAADNL